MRPIFEQACLVQGGDSILHQKKLIALSRSDEAEKPSAQVQSIMRFRPVHEWIAERILRPVLGGVPGNGTGSALSCAASFLVATVIAVIPFHPPAQGAVESAPADYYVAVNGRDDWSGRLAAPNETMTDGPFASIRRARDAVREQKKTATKKHLAVLIRGGVYRLKETLVFSPKDSAAMGGTTTYAAYPNEQPILTSGVPIRNWRRPREDPQNLPAAARGKVWIADLPPEIDWCFTLYDGEDRLPRARGEGFAPVDAADKTTAPDRLTFPPGALHDWPDLTEGELLVIPTADYEMNILPLASVDEKTHIATTSARASRPIGKVKFVPTSVWAENVLEVLDQPGEWAVNLKERRVYLWPRGARPSETIVAPKLTELLRVEGTIDESGPSDSPVTGLIFRGLTFNHAERYQWHSDAGWGLQHHWEMFDRPTAALRFRGAEECVVQGCRFAATSGAGIRLDLSCRKNRILDNEIGHIGGVGILLAGYGPGVKDVNRQNEVSNNWIHHTGEIHWATPAIMVWQSGQNRIANNLIHNVPYSGITVSTRAGWNRAHPEGDRTMRWSEIPKQELGDWNVREPYLHARGNFIERNDIHHVMETMGDGDGVYISGTGRDNMIRQNFIHDIDSDGAADGIRCDDDQHETIIEGNIIWRTRCIGQGICSKGVNHIVNNIIADLLPSRRPIRPERVVRGYIGLEVNPVDGSRIERNIVLARSNTRPPMIQDRRYGQGAEPLLRKCRADFNLYYCLTDPEWGRKHLQTEQAFGVETHSLSENPLFTNLEQGDFRLKPESPAWKLGFKPVEFSKIGIKPGHPFWRPAQTIRSPK